MTHHDLMQAGLVGGVGSFLCYLVLVLLGIRLLRKIEPAVLVTGLAVVCGPLGVALGIFSRSPFNIWAMLSSYSFLSLCFLMVFGAVYKSLSLRILLGLMARPARTDSCRRLFDAYLFQDSYKNRLGVAVGAGLVAEEEGQLRLTTRGETLARRVRAVQLFFGISRSG